MKLSTILSSAFFLCFFLLAQGKTQDLYAFNEPQKEAEFSELLKNLRCLVCQNQDLHDSQTMFAENMRDQIHQWILEGKSQKEIMKILIDHYGDTIAFQPPLKRSTALLWIAPFVLFVSMIIFLLMFIRKK